MKHSYTNQLINETSPYLLQHAHNPVNWMAWNDEAWQQAKQDDKLVIVSIGYSACHWCHVMEHESFEDTVVAQIMNDHFISIKVDREERPDVDQIYMDACQLISGRGGWPLNAITLPDGRPLYAGTYFPKENWKQVLLYFVDYWKNKREEALERAAQITNGIRTMDTIELKTEATAFTASDRENIFQRFNAVWDYEKGGRSGAPKFPMPVNLQYLLQNHYYTNNEKPLQAALVTLNNMMNGGVYDQLGGGFARYSVDADWIIPHFEKMLYDNAQLVSVYSSAYQLTKNERYKEVVFETLDFVERELSDPAGGFYSALDADSEGEEGKFYVWHYDELKKILGKEFDDFCKVYAVSYNGNFEGANNLVRKPDAKPDNNNLTEWKTKLLKERTKRIRPGLDNKVLTAWNALMLKGYTDAYRAFGEERFLARALRCADFLTGTMINSEGAIQRSYKNGKTTISGFLDDYSFTIEAFIALYQITFNETWLAKAQELTDYTIQHFYNLNTGLFYYTNINDAPLIARKTETSDNVIPSSNSSMAKALYQLGLLTGNNTYTEKAKRALLLLKENTLQHPSFYANWALLADWFADAPAEVVIAGENALALNKEFSTYYLPGSIVSGAVKSSKLPLLEGRIKERETLIYVCYNKTCQLPVKTVREAVKQVRKQ
ncbi:MAG: thioredoxin domain-containing protein [Chitinophagales bacterium]|nr:thioredoxin domain-containing protein [Chitinophagales bacterium]